MDLSFLEQIKPLYIVIALIIIALIIFLMIINGINKNKNKQPDLVPLPFALDDLIKALGSLDNINEVSATNSKVSFKFKDNSKVNIDSIKEYGASGIVETSNGITFIFGSISKSIEKLVKEKL